MSSGPYDAWKDSQPEREYIKVERYPTRFKIGDNIWFWCNEKATRDKVNRITVEITKKGHSVCYQCSDNEIGEEYTYRTKEDCLEANGHCVCECGCGAKKGKL